MCAKIRNLLVVFCVLVSATGFQQQYFRVVPRSLRVQEGSEAVLECAVANLAGQVQWAKDGFALGFSSVIPGYPRYTMFGERRHGIYNLRIVNVTLEDDAEYQCQVGPAQMHKVIRANASLTVISPPNAVEITNHPPSSKLEVKEGEEVSLECLVKNAKPAARIVWYRGNVELKGDKVSKEEIKEVENVNGNPKAMRYTTVSRVHFKATADDDYADFTCEARHEALHRDSPMRSTVQLSVLYPPGAPYIEGYAEGETVRRGQSLELVCRSRGGNPPAQLIWYKNGEQIRMAYRTSGRMSENVLSFKADASDNKARYTCEAKNIMISNTLKAEIDLTVLFAPSHVTISGPSEARVGDPVPLTCSTAPSNPAADIKWLVLGKHHKEASNRTVISPEGGWITTSNITVVVEPNKRSIVVVCHGINAQLTENVVATHTINVLYPPTAPMITGYIPGTTLSAGTVQRLSCISSGGNPLATLTWFKNDKKIHSVTKQTERSVSAEISILTNVTDNQAQYRCEATNSATEIPLFETVTLNVYFAPEAVKVRVEPEELKVGIEATLFCDAASSNPPATLSWWRDGIPVQGLPMQLKKGLHGGTVSTIELKMNITKDLNGAVYTCQAMNEALQRSVHDALALKVLYSPIFDETTPYTTVGVENEPLIIVLRADGNPGSITYTWTKDGLPITLSSYSTGNDRIISEGSMLNMTKLTRHDAGIYTCEAVNSQGAAVANISVSVHYPASIKAVSQLDITNPNQDAILSCTATGNPLTADNFRWERKGYKINPNHVTFEPRNSTSFLLIKQAKREDVGNFKCIVDNGIGSEAKESVMLVVKFKPELDSSPSLMKSASNVGQVGRLTCKCKSAPAPNFTWSKNGAKLPVNTSTKYFAEYHKLDAVTYTSILLINDVSSSDYGSYECGARNDLGFSTTSVKLDITSAPDQVISLIVSNVTHNTVTLQWVPGFDGGLPSWFRVRYRRIYEESYKYEDVIPRNATTFTIGGLDRNTDYVFSVMAINKIGQSKYRPDDTKVTTLTSSEVGELNVVSTEHVETADVSKSVVIYVSITGVVLVLINAALVACFVLKRRSRRLKEQAGQASKSATIEMYAPSSYNDTMTGETLSSVSEKSEYSQDDGADDRQPPPIPEVPSMPTRHMLSQPVSFPHQTSDAFLMDDQGLVIPPPLDYPPPNYAVYDAEHARTLPHPHRHKDISGHSTLGRSAGKQNYVPAPSPMPPLDGSYYNMSSDRYLSYPPLIGEYLQQQQGRTPTPPQQYGQPLPKPHLMNGGLSTGSPSHMASPPHSYALDDRQSAGGTLRRQRMDKMAAVPPPDVTVLHQGNCAQHLTQTPAPKQPQSILKDPSRHKYGNQYGSPISSSTPQNSSQILTVQNLTSDVPQYGTIKKENKKQNVTIDESYNKRSETHVV
ncbi:nephrin adhesion molecule sticks and stones isoform X1 [Anticarsia gemmatalis]|uniref:nephrin adhesion molecule sticks and stones isoform X1 n=1 Tax=Anticarsia gemmatalis TaxID=129554 RepID=UPI003F75F6DF